MQKNKENSKKSIKFAVIILFMVLIVALSILNEILSQKNASKDNNIKSSSVENVISTEDNSAIIEKLQNMKERDRMEYYFGVFLDYVENEKYEKAYNLLNSSFKENYFPTLEDFKSYCGKTFTDMMNVEHTNIERNGDVYVLWVEITDAINGTKDSAKEINVVIKENNYYDFEMSFSVI